MNKIWVYMKRLLLGLLLSLALALPGQSMPAVYFRNWTTSIAQASLSPDDAAERVQQGQSRYQAGQLVEAIALWQHAEHVYQSQGDRLNRARVLNFLALALAQVGDWNAAEQAIATSFEQLQTTSDETARVLAQAWNTQGNLHLMQGNPEAALESWETAATLYHQHDDTIGELGSLLNQAQALQSMGLFLRSRQQLEQAEQQVQQQPDDQLKATGLLSLGNVMRLMGDLDGSRRVLDEALALTAATPSLSVALLSDLYLSAGNTARAQGNAVEALAFYQQAEAIATGLPQVRAQLNQLSLQLDASPPSLDPLIASIQAQLSQLPPSRDTVYAQINLAYSLSQMQSPIRRQQAAETLAVAVQQAQQLQDPRATAYALGQLGQLYEKTQQWAAAKQLTEQALLSAQAIAAADMAYQWQWQLGRILKAQNQPQAAIAAYQSAFDTLQSIRSDLAATDPNLQFSFRESVEPLYRQLVDLLLTRSQPDDLARARTVMEALRLSELDNFFRSACLDQQRVVIDQIDQTATVVVYPIVLPERLELLVSSPDEPLRQFTVAVSQPVLNDALAQWRQNLEKPFTSPEGRQLGQQLYNWLIAPFAAELAQQPIDSLVFVLDGALRNVPMAALYDGDHYLIERYSVAIAPGLQLVAPKPLESQTLTVLAAGLSQERYGFSPLSNVPQELNQIQAEVPSQILLDESFTSETLQAQISAVPYPVVHLATHGQFSSSLDETFVLAWDKPININELSDLLRRRSEDLSQAIELLVLSACETAAGDDRAALGLAGVAVQAGARSTIASLWTLDDASGAKLVETLYAELATANGSKANALRNAQLSLLQDPDYRHPRYWAPYVLIGNWL